MVLYALDSSEITLKIDSTSYIKIILPQSLDFVFRYDDVVIVYYAQDGTEYTLYKNDFIIYALRVLYYSLESLFKSKRKLHESITKNIGYLWNKEMWGKDKSLVEEQWPDGTIRWVGLRNTFFSGKGIMSWLYEKDDKIYLEITPTYQWPSAEEKKRGCPTYREFLKNYKPYVVTTLDREVAQDWYKKAGELLAIVEANDDKHKDILDAMPVFIKPDEQEN